MTGRKRTGQKRRLTPPMAVLVVVTALATGCGDQEMGALRPAGPDAELLHGLFWVMLGLGLVVFVLVMMAFVRAARADGSELDDDEQRRRSTRLVVGGGIVLPIVVLVPLTVTMMAVGSRLAPRLGDAYEIEVTSHQFWWEVHYPETGMVTANEIHIPVDTRVRLLLETDDVIHSFWVPQLAGKIDMIPGQTTEVVIEADDVGAHLGICAEFCGVQHARMRFEVIVHERNDFRRWLDAQTADAAPPVGEAARRGMAVFAERGCAACHAVRGTDAVGDLGPDLTHLASRRSLGALTVPNRRGHLGGWIIDSQAVKPGNLMPPVPMPSEQLLDLIVYLEGLS